MKALDLDNFNSIQVNINELEPEANKKDIAIIGMSGIIGSCKNIDSFWQSIVQGNDQIHNLTDARTSNCRDLLKSRDGAVRECNFYEADFMDEIDTFDYAFFGISPKEASLMNPHQRLFLENVWSTIEDAGYGGGQLAGSNTGIYLGLMSDAGDDYREYVLKQNPSMAGIISVGNMNSITAGRVSYLFDLKGPSMMIDTACSSGLTAVHLACRAIRNGDCDMAVAGSIKIDLIPLDNGHTDIDIISSDRRTRTFDHDADGTGSGEGVCSVLLKSYEKAMDDGDQVYAVIKGSAVNQDGNSIGLTAPNSIAQEEVIVKAWQDAGILPDTIAYMEAHGTGTKLGDPVEISAITKAFSRYTDKKQFCAITSVKSNIGHLNHASGMAGLIKAALALKHHIIPPTIHFNRPNRKIDFIDSPVYVNDKCSKWDKNVHPRRAGVSAFGLSGTNCHVIVEEGPANKIPVPCKEDNHLLVLSAQYEHGIHILVNNYMELLHHQPQIDLKNMCITASTGRGHYSFRMAILFTDRADLKSKLDNIMANKYLADIAIPGVYYGRNNSISNSEESLDWQRLEEIALAYIHGASINWKKLYRGITYQKVSLPTYPYQKNRCWTELTEAKIPERDNKLTAHPFVDDCIADSIYSIIYRTMFSVSKHWILNEHKINDFYIVPGISFIELAGELGTKHYPCSAWNIQDLVFIHPLVVDDREDQEVHTILQKKEGYFEFTVAGRQNEKWTKHAEGRFSPLQKVSPSYLNILEVKRTCQEKKAVQHSTGANDSFDVGPRWDVIESLEFGEQTVLAYLKLPDKYQQDLNEFYLHPSMLDSAMNAAIQMIGEGLYLPWGYKSIEVYSKMPKECYSYLRRKDHGRSHTEAATFDITVCDLDGKILIEVTDYMVKKVNNVQKELEKLVGKTDYFYQTGWIKQELQETTESKRSGCILVFRENDKKSESLVQRLRNKGNRIVEVRLGNEYKKIDENTYYVASDETSYIKLMENIRQEEISCILHLLNLNVREMESKQQFEEGKLTGVMSLYYLTRALLANQIKWDIDIVLIACQVYEVTQREEQLSPLPAALFGLGKVIRQEYSKMKCRSIDIDANTRVSDIIKEVNHAKESNLVAYRDGQRYVEVLKQLDIQSIPERNVQIRNEGVYVITGGMGGIGIEFGTYIAGKNKVHLVLLNRSMLPKRTSWKEILEQNEDIGLIRKIKAIQEMEKAGSMVSCYSVDVSDEAALSQVIDEVHQKYGRINGIFHCAGVAGDGLLINREEAKFRSVLQPKMDGTWLLDQLTRQDNLDFFVLFSSISSLLGVLGQGDYAAANAYLDSYAAYSGRMGRNALCINWPAWKDTGMAVDYGVNRDGVFQAISNIEAMQGFERVWKTCIHNVVISQMNQEYHVEEFPIKVSNLLQMNQIERNYYDNETSRGNTSYSTTEQRVAAIWSKVLGIADIDKHDNFNQLGGNSVLAVSLHWELEKEFPDRMDITDVYSYPTISQMSEYIKSKTTDDDPKELILEEDDMDVLLEKLANGKITEDQIDNMV